MIQRAFYIFFIIIITFITYQNVKAQEKTVDYRTMELIRNLYYSSVEDENQLEKLDSLIKITFSDSISNYPPIILAYYGGIQALKAKHAFWPFNKLSYFNSSMDILEKAVEKGPENLEIRFIRFAILDNVPGILRYRLQHERNKSHATGSSRAYPGPGREENRRAPDSP